jgi:hypothetical protein
MVTEVVLNRNRGITHFMRVGLLVFALLAQSQAAEVLITSDPSGSLITSKGKELGVTPLTLQLPSGQPVEMTSRYEMLTPLTHTVTPQDGRVIAYQFNHRYATLVVSSERTDAALVIDGTGYGHPPASIIVPPGRHTLFLTAANLPEKTREVALAAGERATVEIDFSRGSPQTKKTGGDPDSVPVESPAPAPAGSPSPENPGVKPEANARPQAVWQEPPPYIPTGANPPKAASSTVPLPKQKPGAEDGQDTHRVALLNSNDARKGKTVFAPWSLPSSRTADAQVKLNQQFEAQTEALRLEKEQIEIGIKDSTGALQEQWKYRLAVWRAKAASLKTAAATPKKSSQ